MDDASSLDRARAAASRYLREQGYAAEAALVSDGQGDDFAEVRMALSLLAILDAPKVPPVKHRGRRLVGEEC